MRLIDADALQFEPDSHGIMNGVGYVHNSRVGGKVMTLIQTALKRMIVNAPTVDAVPVIHSHWIETEKGMKCSNCNCLSSLFDNNLKSVYCPWCGAKMDKEVNSDA